MKTLTYWEDRKEYRLTVRGTLAEACIEMIDGQAWCALCQWNPKTGHSKKCPLVVELLKGGVKPEAV